MRPRHDWGTAATTPRTAPPPSRGARSAAGTGAGERGAIAANLIEIGVAMLAVGLLAAGALTSFTGFIDRSADTAARGALTDAQHVAASVYNELRSGGRRCLGDSDCVVTNAAMVDALNAEAGKKLVFDFYDPTVAGGGLADASLAGTVLVQVASVQHAWLPGSPDDGHWLRLMVRSRSGATFCMVRVLKADNPSHQGIGYMSVSSDRSATPAGAAHCGAAAPAAAQTAAAARASCVWGADGWVYARQQVPTPEVYTAADKDPANGIVCQTSPELTEPDSSEVQGPAAADFS